MSDYRGFRWPRRSDRQLLTAATASGPEAGEAWRQWLAGTDLDDIDGPAQSLIPQVMLNFQRNGIEVPEAGRLKGLLHRTWYENKLTTHAASQALTVLKAAGIEAMLLKGAALLAMRAGGTAARTMGDVDILVRPGEARRAAALLLAEGWRTTWLPVEALDVVHAIELRSASEQSIDLHRSMLEDNPCSTADEGAWARSREAVLNGVPARVPSVEDLLIGVCVHGTRAMPRPTLRWVLDARDLILDAGDSLRWEVVVAVARERKATLAISEALGYLRAEFGVPVPAETLAALRSSRRGPVERVDYRAQGNKDRVPYAILSTFTRYLRQDTNRSWWLRARMFPRFLQSLWGADSLLKVPGMGLRRVLLLRRGAHHIKGANASRARG
jgi:hypothetical protein